MDTKKVVTWIGIFLVLILILWGLYVVAKKDTANNETPNQTPAALPVAVSASDWSEGPDTAPLTIVEYSDFQCPACLAYYPVLKDIIAANPTKIKFVYRYYPIVSIHPNAIVSAQAAEAAGRQGAFWPMHDMLFDHQNDWKGVADPYSIFEGYAQSLKLDINKFKQDYSSADVRDKINGQLQAAADVGIRSTPTFFINGVQLTPPPSSLDEFKSIITQQLAGK